MKIRHRAVVCGDTLARMIKRVAALVCAGFLLAAVFGHWHSAFYTVLRFIVCAVSLYAAAEAANDKQPGWAVGLAVTGILFNPLVQFHMQRGSWRIVDGIATLMMLVYAVSYAPAEP